MPAYNSVNLPPSCADVKKSEVLNLLGPCGPVQACNGTALTFTTLLQRGHNVVDNWMLKQETRQCLENSGGQTCNKALIPETGKEV
jgi:hypothetical protein